MQKTTLATLEVAALAAAFNLVYTDYITPAHVDADWMLRHTCANDIRLEHSPLWLDEAGEVVALAMLGVRGKRGWIGGFGVAPAHRGRGLSHALVRAILAVAGDLELRQVQLEVIVGNERAIRTYERAGFRRTRDLRIFTATAEIAGRTHVSDGLVTTVADVPTLLGARARVTSVQPAWQREPAGLTADAGLQAIAIGSPEAPGGYALYRVGPSTLSLADTAAPDAHRATALLGALAQTYPGMGMSLVNEPEESPVCATLERLGWAEPLRQHEMIRLIP